MNDKEFWQLISLINMESVDQEDCFTGVQNITAALAEKTPDEIRAFEESISQKLYELDSQARLDQSCGSSDGFLYQRCYMIAKGAENYGKALKDETLICDDFSWCENLLYVARNAWSQSQGSKWDFNASVSYETGANSQKY